MQDRVDSKKVITNMIWRLMERSGAQFVGFVVQIILARMLVPEYYGSIALITVFTAILNVFIDCGLGTALIQKKDADDVDFSTVFYFNVTVGIALYLLMFLTAPMIAGFYEDQGLTPVIRVLCITLIIDGVKNVQVAYISKRLQFKRFFFATMGGTVGAAVIGILLAYRGYGIWALAVQQVFNSLVDTLILWFTVSWRPKRLFSFDRLKNLLSYGWKLSIAALLDNSYQRFRELVIGKKYSPSDLAFFNRGQDFPHFIISIVTASLNNVLFSTMSAEQDDRRRIREITRRSIQIGIHLIAPVMTGLIVVAEPTVRLLLTEKWLPCVPFLCIFSVNYILYPVHLANLDAMKALGRSDLFLKLEIIKKVLGVTVLVLTMWSGPLAMAYGLLLTSLVGQYINARPNKGLLDYGYLEQLKDMIPSLLIAVVTGLCAYSIRFLGWNDAVTLLVQICTGMVIYIGLSAFFRIEAYSYLVQLIKRFGEDR